MEVTKEQKLNLATKILDYESHRHVVPQQLEDARQKVAKGIVPDLSVWMGNYGSHLRKYLQSGWNERARANHLFAVMEYLMGDKFNADLLEIVADGMDIMYALNNPSGDNVAQAQKQLKKDLPDWKKISHTFFFMCKPDYYKPNNFTRNGIEMACDDVKALLEATDSDKACDAYVDLCKETQADPA